MTRSRASGQPCYSPFAILTGLTLRAVFCLALRQTEGLIGSIIGLLGLALAVPDHSTLSRRAKTLEVPRPQPRFDSEPLHLALLSTGPRMCGAGEWLLEKHGTKTRPSWRKLHIGLDGNSGQIVAASFTAKEADDGAEVGSLLDQITGAVASFAGVGGYDQDRCWCMDGLVGLRSAVRLLSFHAVQVQRHSLPSHSAGPLPRHELAGV